MSTASERSERGERGKSADRARRHQERRAELEAALARVLLATVRAFQEELGPPTPRELANCLRGRSASPGDATSHADWRPLHGLLSGFDARALIRLLESLVEEGFLESAGEPGRRVHVSESGERLLASRALLPVELPVSPPLPGERPEAEAPLEALRRRIAKSEGRPSFSIFDNLTLAWIARRRPRTLDELASAPGFGPRRLARYGRRVLRALASTASESVTRGAKPRGKRREPGKRPGKGTPKRDSRGAARETHATRSDR